jgi:hypothetical protein
MHDESATADAISHSGSGAYPRDISAEELITVALAVNHRTDLFICDKSPRVAGFFVGEGTKFIRENICRVFVAPNPDDADRILGFYTLSADGIPRERCSNSHEKKVGKLVKGYPVPMARIGFMGRDDASPRGFGSSLLVDAARRAWTSPIAAWGVILEPEGGQAGNPKLWSWYLEQGFRPCRNSATSVYAPIKSLVPELQS